MAETATNTLANAIQTSPERVLIVDDDREIVRLLRAYLEQAGFEVLTAGDGETALHILRSDHPDLVVLDLMLPNRDGWSVIKAAHEDSALADIPIIVLTARVDDSDRLLGLKLGADDYVTKPFNPREVVLRARSVLRHSRGSITNSGRCSHILQVGALLMDLGRHEVWAGQRLANLTATEFRLLQTLMEWPGYVFTRSELIEQALGYEYEGMDRTLDSHIKNLRRKIEPDPSQPIYIETVYGVGYRLAGPLRVGQADSDGGEDESALDAPPAA